MMSSPHSGIEFIKPTLNPVLDHQADDNKSADLRDLFRHIVRGMCCERFLAQINCSADCESEREIPRREAMTQQNSTSHATRRKVPQQTVDCVSFFFHQRQIFTCFSFGFPYSEHMKLNFTLKSRKPNVLSRRSGRYINVN